MALRATQLEPGTWYLDSDDNECVAVEYQEYSTLVQGERDLLIVYPHSGRAFPPHLISHNTLFRRRHVDIVADVKKQLTRSV